MFSKSFATITLIATLPILVSTSPVVQKRAQPAGIDVSAYQPNIDWNTVKANGISFAYIKATEGTGANISYHIRAGIFTP